MVPKMGLIAKRAIHDSSPAARSGPVDTPPVVTAAVSPRDNGHEQDDLHDLRQSLLSSDEFDDAYTSFLDPRRRSREQQRRGNNDHRGVLLTVHETKEAMEGFFSERSPWSEATWERYLVENYLRHVSQDPHLDCFKAHFLVTILFFLC